MTSPNDQILDDAQAIPQTTYASFSNRLVATIIDVIVLLVAGYGVGLIVTMTGMPGGQYVGYLLGLAYTISLHYTRGATLGKMALKIRVVNVDGGPLSLEQAFTREFFAYLYIAASIISETLMPASLRGGQTDFDPSTIMSDLLGLWMVIALLALLIPLIDALWMLGNDRNQTLHDIVAKTYCVKTT